MFRPRDEIYWMAGAGSDSGGTTTYASDEFGSIVSGSERTFPTDAILFRGNVTGIMTADIECWEKDRGSFWQSIRDALADVANYCADAAVSIQEHGEREDAALAALIAIISGLLGALLDWLMGKDDLIQQRNIAFKRAALDRLRTAEDYWNFVGEGAHYRLYVRIGGPRRLFDDWPGLRNTSFAGGGFTATNVPGDGTDVYLFKGDQYMRYDAKRDRIVAGPSRISDAWPGLRGTAFAAGGFDAAAANRGSSSEVYLFKADQYVRYNVGTETIAAAPRTISDGWPGTRDTTFATGGFGGAAIAPYSNTDIYTFRNNQYIKYDTSVECIVS